MPAAGAKASKYGRLCRVSVQMIGLRVKKSGEGDNGVFV